MKRKIKRRPAGILIAFAVVGLAAAGSLLTVQVRRTQLRSKPHYLLGKKIGEVRYGDKLTEISRSKGWVQVKLADGKQGWIHSSALTSQTIRLKASRGKRSGTTSEEMALAGRGFSQTVENEYRKSNRDLDFATLDWAEKNFDFSTDELLQFRKEGKLVAGGEGQ